MPANTKAVARRRRSRLAALLDFRSWAPRVVGVLAVAYPATLLVILLGLRYVGESFWVTTAGLFVPHLALALPLPVIAALLWWFKRRRLLWTQGLALLLLWPLTGFVVPTPTGARDGVPTLKVLTFNVNSGYAGYDNIYRAIQAYAPDLVLVQEAYKSTNELAELLKKSFPSVTVSTQFVLASRFPILETTDPEKVPYLGRQRSPRFMRYVLATSLGELAVYSVHPISPRGVLSVHRFRDIPHALRSGALLSDESDAGVTGNAGLRVSQVETVAKMAAAEARPVIIGGDFNLPALSPAFRNNFDSYADAFSTAGWGFGYTFPADHPWLRIDHVLASSALRITAVEVGCDGLSDHHCVVTEIERR